MQGKRKTNNILVKLLRWPFLLQKSYIQGMKEKEKAPISHNWDFADNLNNSKLENKTN
jgi:hypothetical protein